MREKKERKKKSCREQGLFWLEYGNRTSFEMIKYLKDKEYEEGEIADCMEFLIDCDFINDEAFVERYIENSMERGRGPLRIRQELKEKKAPQEAVNLLMEELYDHSVERELVEGLVKKQLAKMGSEGKLEDKEKARIVRRLAAQGFSASTIYSVVGSLCL